MLPLLGIIARYLFLKGGRVARFRDTDPSDPSDPTDGERHLHADVRGVGRFPRGCERFDAWWELCSKFSAWTEAARLSRRQNVQNPLAPPAGAGQRQRRRTVSGLNSPIINSRVQTTVKGRGKVSCRHQQHTKSDNFAESVILISH